MVGDTADTNREIKMKMRIDVVKKIYKYLSENNIFYNKQTEWKDNHHNNIQTEGETYFVTKFHSLNIAIDDYFENIAKIKEHNNKTDTDEIDKEVQNVEVVHEE